MNADTILAIPLDEPGRLFQRAQLDQQRKELLKAWHPDRNKDPKAGDVLNHILKLADLAKERIEAGTWQTPGLLELKHASGRYEIRYQSKRNIEIGTMYVGRTAVTFVIDKIHQDLVEDAKRSIASISYPSDRVREQIERFMPKIIGTIETDTHVGFALSKTNDVLLLSDIKNHFIDRHIPPVHVAWIISSLMNLACFCQVTDLVLPGLDSESVFISPPHHTTPLLGGWWFATKGGGKIKALTRSAYETLPPSLISKPTTRINTELIKAIGRDLLVSTAPKPMTEWLALPSSNDAIQDYAVWRDKVLKDSFGERRFSKLEITETDLYR